MIFEDIEKEVDIIIDKFGKDIGEVISRVSELISMWMLDNDISKISTLKFDIVVDEILTKAGYYDVVNRFIDDDYDKLYPMIQSNLALTGAAIIYTTFDLQNIMALKALDKDKFSILASTAGSSLRESLTKYAISNYNSLDIQNAIVEEFKGTNLAKHSKTIADTAISQFQQSVINIKAAESDFKDYVWFYDGANIDEVTRDYCKCILKKQEYYTEDEKNILERNPKRRYNCRHKFYFGTVEYVEDEGFKKSAGVRCS